MVTPAVKRSAPKRRRGTLTKKLFRDMRHSLMQFLAMLLLCALGTWVFSGLDATWRMLDLSIETYFDDGNLADFWVKGASFTKQDLSRLSRLAGVEAIQPRTTLVADCPELGEDVTAAVNAYDGEMRINKPLIREGEGLSAADRRGCLVEEQFAQAQGLQVGDTLTLTLGGAEQRFVVRGIVMSCEYSITAKDVTPDPSTYGFVLLSHEALAGFPFNDVLVDLAPGADADAVVAEIERALPSALVLTQETHGPTVSARNFTSMFRNLCYLFPVLVFAVAAMVVMTTLSRMMENQRTQMGTLKALGYRDGQIRRHYLAYALVPSLIGSLIGTLTGQWTLPYVLWRMVVNNARFPWRLHAPISLASWCITGLSVLLSLFICLRTYNRAARETTASLLRPKPPRSGTRILLERIGWLWRRFSFNTKMIVRNLMRNKGRTLMALVGIICCNMLIICTFGLIDSISFFVGQYYGGTLDYDLRVDLDTSLSGTLESYQARLDAERVEGVMELSVSLSGGDSNRTCLMTVLDDDQTMIRLSEDQTVLPMPGDGVIISRKLAQVMHISLGEPVKVLLAGDPDPLTLTVEGFADTNIGQGLFIGRDAWEGCRKGGFAATALLLRAPSAECRHVLSEMDEAADLKDPQEQYAQTMRIMDSTTLAFSIMSGAALGLAFVICYNMGLMNFTERTRDYATLKVLGYHQREIRGLMMRENNLTAILGVLLGIYPGVALTGAILKLCEYDSMVFTAHVTLQSIVLPCLITYAFTFLIEWLLTRKVRHIDMVEALKSVE